MNEVIKMGQVKSNVHFGEINILEKGAIGDGIADDTVAIQMVLDMAKQPEYKGGITVIIPDGVYKTTSKLVIYRNTTLRLAQNAKIIRGGYVSLLINGDEEEDPLLDPDDKYSGHGNITIEGGIWDGNILSQPYAVTGFNIFAFTRAKNIIIRGVEFRDVVTCHALDMNAIDGLLIDNCRFLGYKDATPLGHNWHPRDYSEAIQISNLTTLGASGTGEFDGTPCKNVTVNNCYFGASGTPGTQAWPTGVGNHGAVHDKYNENINILNNTYKGMTYAGVRNFKFKNCKVIGNTFDSCNRDITCSNPSGNDSSSNKWDEKTKSLVQFGVPQAGMNFIISLNIFVNTRHNILWVRGQAKGTIIAKFDGILFTDNQIKRDNIQPSSSNLIDLTWCKNVSVNNVKLYKANRGISIHNCDKVSLKNCYISDTLYEGILISELNNDYRNLGHTADINIINIYMSNIKYNGMLINFLKRGKISECILDDIANSENNVRNGIMVASNSEEVVIENNKIRSGKLNKNMYGIYVTSGCSNCRVALNEVEGQTAPVNVNGNTNWIGHYAYSTNGKRYRVTISNFGSPIYTQD